MGTINFETSQRFVDKFTADAGCLARMEIISETAVPLLRCWACFRDYTKLPLWGILLSDVKILYKINFWFMGLINWEEWNMSRLGGWDKSLKFKGVFSTNCFHLIEDLWLSFIEPPDYNSWLYATATEQSRIMPRAQHCKLQSWTRIIQISWWNPRALSFLDARYSSVL